MRNARDNGTFGPAYAPHHALSDGEASEGAPPDETTAEELPTRVRERFEGEVLQDFDY